jgi:hypothetical protein
MKNISKQLTIFFALWGCSLATYSQIVGYKEMYNGIFIEQFANNDSLFQCSDDNIIYCIGKTFTFKFQYASHKGEPLSFINIKNTGQWKFVSDSIDTGVFFLVMRLLSKTEAEDCFGYQTAIEYYYLTQNKRKLPNKVWIWLVENPKNILLPPANQYLFNILELNPYPYLQFPIELKKKWKWEQKVFDDSADERWKTWEGTITNKYVYTIVDTACQLSTGLGSLICCKINSKATSKLGKTFLTAYFHSVYGFVRLEYTNIDKSMVIIDLIKVE